MGKMPDGWLDYTPVGRILNGTRFIAFKVPLDMDQNHVDEFNRLDPEMLIKFIPNLGLIIDLTDTTRYYKPNRMLSLGLEYKKVKIPGHVLPPKRKHEEFMEIVNDYLTQNADNDKLIGVHCTHGCNRTGLMICSFLIQNDNFTPEDALQCFQTARGHDISRENYVKFINTCKYNPSITKSNDPNTRSTQTELGTWIPNEKCFPLMNNHEKININGCVNIRKTDLIPDGKDGYFVYIPRDAVNHRHNDNQYQYQNTYNQNYYGSRGGGGVGGGMGMPTIPPAPAYYQNYDANTVIGGNASSSSSATSTFYQQYDGKTVAPYSYGQYKRTAYSIDRRSGNAAMGDIDRSVESNLIGRSDTISNSYYQQNHSNFNLNKYEKHDNNQNESSETDQSPRRKNKRRHNREDSGSQNYKKI